MWFQRRGPTTRTHIRCAVISSLAALALVATACSEDASDDDDEQGVLDVAPDGMGADVPQQPVDAADTTVDDVMDGSPDPDATQNDAEGDVDEPIDGGKDAADVMPDGADMTDIVETDGSVADVTSDTDQDMTDATQDVTVPEDGGDTTTVDAAPDTRQDIANITCPPPNSSGCGIGTPTVVWAKDPATGACCKYNRACLAPSNWQTYPNEQTCLSS
jgi:hypothetical protein